jgi:hypothetical protein
MADLEVSLRYLSGIAERETVEDLRWFFDISANKHVGSEQFHYC